MVGSVGDDVLKRINTVVVRVWGLLLIFVRRSPLMPDEELRLLSLFAEQSALALDYAALIEQLRGVEEEVEEEGFDA